MDVWERYTGPYSEEFQPFVEAMLRKRVAVRLDVERVRSWDHRKLGMGPHRGGRHDRPPIWTGPACPALADTRLSTTALRALGTRPWN